jgi:HEPN domain-containing protein
VFRRDFQSLSVIRAREAQTLLRAQHCDGAYYLAGLAVENALKACIARATQRYEFPDRDRANRVYTHKLEGLLIEAGLQQELRSTQPAVREAWGQVKVWQIDARYETGRPATEVKDFLRAVAGQDGVLRWLKRFW